MTSVSITMRDGYAKVHISGHAGYGYARGLPAGHDIVCAAISMIGQTLMQRIIDMSEEKKLVINKMKSEPGEISLRVLAKNGCAEELESTLKTVAAGYQMLEKEYPEYVEEGCWIREKVSGIIYAYGKDMTLGKDREKGDTQ